MFDFDRGDDLELIVETARSFAVDELFPKAARSRARACGRVLGPTHLRRHGSRGASSCRSPWAVLVSARWSRVLVNEEIAAGDAGAALALDPFGPALYPLLEVGGEEALEAFALPLLEEEGARAVLVSSADAELEIGAEVSGRVPWGPGGSGGSVGRAGRRGRRRRA